MVWLLTISMTFAPAKDFVNSMKGLSFPSTTVSSKATILRGVSGTPDAAADGAGCALASGPALAADTVGGHTLPEARSSIRDVAASRL